MFLSLLVLFTLVSDTPTCEAVITEFAVNSGYSTAQNVDIWSTEDVSSLIKSTLPEGNASIVSSLRSGINVQLSPDQRAGCWRRLGEAATISSKFELSAELHAEEMSVLLLQRLPDSVVSRYFALQDLWATQASYMLDVKYAAALNDLGDRKNAIGVLERLIIESDRSISSLEYAGILNTIANIYYELERYDEAEHYYKEAIIRIDSDNPKIIGYRINLASVYKQQERYDEAITLLREQISAAASKNMQVEELQTRINLANLLKEVGQYDQSRALYLSFISQARESGFESVLFFGYYNFVDWHLQLNKIDEVKPWIDTLFSILPQESSHYNKVGAYAILARYYSATGQSETAQFYEEAVEDLESMARDGETEELILAELYRLSFSEARQTVEFLRDSELRNSPWFSWGVVSLVLIALAFIILARNTRGEIDPSQHEGETEVKYYGLAKNQTVATDLLLSAIRSSEKYIDHTSGPADLISSLDVQAGVVSEVMKTLELSSVISLVNFVRVLHAIEIMRERPLNVTQDEIMASAGFSNRRTYNRVFKAFTQMPPSDYLDQIRSGMSV